VWSTDRPCALDICNTTRSFTHESKAFVIRRWAFLIFDFIDPLSCIPPPTTLLSTIFGRGAGSWYSPRTQKVVKNSRRWFRFDTLQFVQAHHRACATTPSLTLFENNLSNSAHFSTIWSERKVSKREIFDILFSLLILTWLAGLANLWRRQLFGNKAQKNLSVTIISDRLVNSQYENV